jgi:hypothetical protein
MCRGWRYRRPAGGKTISGRLLFIFFLPAPEAVLKAVSYMRNSVHILPSCHDEGDGRVVIAERPWIKRVSIRVLHIFKQVGTARTIYPRDDKTPI